MVALALLESGRNLDVAQQALQYLTDQRGQFGAYGSTQATVLTLKALVSAAELGGEGGASTVTLSFDGGPARTVVVDDSSGDAVQLVTFDDVDAIGGEPRALNITLEGRRAIQYQVATAYHVPWPSGPSSTPSPASAAARPIRIDVTYDKTELNVNDIVQVMAEVEVMTEGSVGTLLVDLGIPPGFTPVLADLDTLVARGIVARYELTGRQIIFYLTDISSGSVTTLQYGLQARFPIRAQAPQSAAYNYYAPEQQDTAPPQRIIVTLGTPQ